VHDIDNKNEKRAALKAIPYRVR